MKCEDMAVKLTDLMEGDLPETEEVLALEHLASCASCETVLTETQSAQELARNHGRVALSDADRDRMLSTFLGKVADETNE